MAVMSSPATQTFAHAHARATLSHIAWRTYAFPMVHTRHAAEHQSQMASSDYLVIVPEADPGEGTMRRFDRDAPESRVNVRFPK